MQITFLEEFKRKEKVYQNNTSNILESYMIIDNWSYKIKTLYYQVN